MYGLPRSWQDSTVATCWPENFCSCQALKADLYPGDAGIFEPNGATSWWQNFLNLLPGSSPVTTLGDAWILNPDDFASGSNGTFVLTPRTTTDAASTIHVAFALSCPGCATLTGSQTPVTGSTNQASLSAGAGPYNIYNYNTQTNHSNQPISFFSSSLASVTCQDCFLGLTAISFYINIQYDLQNGFTAWSIDIDAKILAQLSLAVTAQAAGQTLDYANLASASVLVLPTFPAGITFAPSITAIIDRTISVQSSGPLSLQTGIPLNH